MNGIMPPPSSVNTTNSVCSLRPSSNQTSIRSFFASSAQTKRRTTLPQLCRPQRTSTTNDLCNNNLRPPKGISQHSALAINLNSKKRISTASSMRHYCGSGNPEPYPIKQRKVDRTKKTQQLYLDLGQRNFAKNIECAVCGMLFVHGLSEDAKRHASICKDYQQGVTFASLDNPRMVQNITLHTKGGRSSTSTASTGVTIVEIRPTDSYALRKKVAQIKVIVDQELGFAENDSDGTNNRTAFLAIANKRIIGMVLVETIDTAYQLLSPSSTGDDGRVSSSFTGLERSNVPRRALMGIHQIWVHQKFRSQGIASSLVDSARSHMVFGYTIPAHQVAFSSPTESGVRFARRYISARVPPKPGVNCLSGQRTRTLCDDPSIRTPDVLVYDCC